MTPTCPQCGDDIDPYFNVCHSCTGAIVAWLSGPPRRIGNWRKRARSAMRSVVESYRNTHETIDVDELIKLVDDAYPFGERAMAPYKAWLAERKELIAVLKPEKSPPAPTAEDYAAVLVAEDLIEMGREDEARKLLDEQAPQRLNRACPVCGQYPSQVCVDYELTTRPLRGDIKYTGGHRTGDTESFYRSVKRIVPHLARVSP